MNSKAGIQLGVPSTEWETQEREEIVASESLLPSPKEQSMADSRPKKKAET